LPYPEVEKSIRLFAAEVMPVLREWNRPVSAPVLQTVAAAGN
jgi:hypothetical protein